MVQRTFYALPSEAPPEVPEWEPAPDDVHTLKWGYNLADLERLARFATRRSWGRHLDDRTRYETAWSAIAETLYSATTAPAPGDLMSAAHTAIAIHAQDELHHLGIDFRTGSMPRFAAYWEHTARSSPSPERGVVDRHALWQIWPHLTGRHRDVLLAHAAADGWRAAAASLGMNEGTFAGLLSTARKQFLALWHEGEQPSLPWHLKAGERKQNAIDSHGKPRITAAQLETIRDRRHAGDKLAAIAADYGVTESSISRLLSGARRPAPDPS